ncbi:2-dehydropantoate 2-reductase [Rhodocyclaceae bacterium]|nr:2-dehydropantoate 2-reductase [Rhodocyclaceae bacterium]
MKIAVMGAGAVGCYYGGMLARAGHEVVMIGRPAHVEAMQKNGLWLDTRDFAEAVRVQAAISPDVARDAQLVLFCVKSSDTENAGAALAPYLGADARVLSLQNGVDNAERLAAVLARPVFPAVVYVACEMAGPGHVRHHGRGELVIGPSDAAAELVSLFHGAGVAVEISNHVEGAQWAKLIINCAYNALSAISQQPYGRLVQAEGVAQVMEDVIGECLTVAKAEGVTVLGDVRAAVQRIAQTMPGQFSSTAQDLRRGKRSEIDHLNGYVVRRAAAHGLAVPANRLLHTLVKLLETDLSASSEKQTTPPFGVY